MDNDTKFSSEELAQYLQTWADDHDPSDELDAYWAEKARECAQQPDLRYATIRRFMRSEWIAMNHAMDREEKIKHEYAMSQFSTFLNKFFT